MTSNSSSFSTPGISSVVLATLRLACLYELAKLQPSTLVSSST